jgi:hypothetical protein
LGLNSAKGAAVRFFVKNRGATVVLPEVVRLETERNLRAELKKYIAELEKNHRQLLAVFGKLKELVLPDAQAIDEKVAAVFGQCQIELREVPLTLESARSSFLKTVDKLPPSDKDQQFKDGVIWAECMRLLDTGDVFLVSSDKAFYKGREYENGLAEALAAEAKHHKYTINVFPTLSALLQTIKTKVQLDEKLLARSFWEINQQSIESILSRNTFAVVGDGIVTADVYITEDPNRLYAEFTITFQCEDLTSDGRSDAVLALRGDCTYLIEEKQFLGLRNYGEELSFKAKDGEDKNLFNIVLFADGIVIGHKTVEHSVKFKVD